VSGIDPWELVRWAVAEGERPEDARLAEAVRFAPIPPDLREYVAARLAGDHVPPVGRPAAPQAERAGVYLRARFLAVEVEERAATYRRERRRTPKQAAERDVAKAAGVSAHTLRDLIRDNLDRATLRGIRERAKRAGEALE
jgi:hypothetical protein